MTKICKYCGEEFETSNIQKIYCSENCKNRAYYYRNREKRIEYQKQYIKKHADYYKEYQKLYYSRGSKKSRLNYPCFEYIGHYVDKIPSEMCLNCSAPECRFYND